MHKNAKFCHSLKVELGFPILFNNLKTGATYLSAGVER